MHVSGREEERRRAAATGDVMPIGSPSVSWTLDVPDTDLNAVSIASGANTTWTPTETGAYTLFANLTQMTLGGAGHARAHDQVTFTVRAPNAPTVTITNPEDGALYSGIAEPPQQSVQFSGQAVDPNTGTMPGSALSWSYRRQGVSTWINAGLGANKTIVLDDTHGCSAITYYEIRLQATSADGVTGTAIITVGVDLTFC